MKAILGQRIRSKTLVNFFETNTFDRSFSRKKKNWRLILNIEDEHEFEYSLFFFQIY